MEHACTRCVPQANAGVYMFIGSIHNACMVWMPLRRALASLHVGHSLVGKCKCVPVHTCKLWVCSLLLSFGEPENEMTLVLVRYLALHAIFFQ